MGDHQEVLGLNVKSGNGKPPPLVSGLEKPHEVAINQL